MTSKPANKNIEWIKGEQEVPVLYVNHAEVRVSVFDIMLNFGTMLEITGSQLNVKRQASIFMSPQHAKEFSILLNKQVALYEEKFGVLSYGEVAEKQTNRKK